MLDHLGSELALRETSGGEPGELAEACKVRLVKPKREPHVASALLLVPLRELRVGPRRLLAALRQRAARADVVEPHDVLLLRRALEERRIRDVAPLGVALLHGVARRRRRARVEPHERGREVTEGEVRRVVLATVDDSHERSPRAAAAPLLVEQPSELARVGALAAPDRRQRGVDDAAARHCSASLRTARFQGGDGHRLHEVAAHRGARPAFAKLPFCRFGEPIARHKARDSRRTKLHLAATLVLILCR